MNIWHNTSSDDRMSGWRQKRRELAILDEVEQLNETALFFASTPFGKSTLDLYVPSKWPSPWEILHSGKYCTNEISLMIYYTLRLLPQYENRIHIVLVNDTEDTYLLPIVDSQLVLNYELGTIRNIDDLHDLKIIAEFNTDQIKQIH